MMMEGRRRRRRLLVLPMRIAIRLQGWKRTMSLLPMEEWFAVVVVLVETGGAETEI